MCDCSEMDRHDYGPCGEDCGSIVRPRSPRERMEAAGWFHDVDDDCNAGWMRCESGTNRVVHYSTDAIFETELSECRAAALRDGWTP